MLFWYITFAAIRVVISIFISIFISVLFCIITVTLEGSLIGVKLQALVPSFLQVQYFVVIELNS
jgi:hypothetical protein